jgi:uncharacterized membrane protein YccC
MIVIQPYFGATFKKAVDRVVGTLLGGVAGGLLLHLPADLHIKEIILFLTFILMVYYIRRQYAIAAFIITLNLVLLFNIEAAYSNMLMVTRAFCTIGGAALAVIAGFALLPTWDKKWLPSHLAAAIRCNYNYFVATFYSADRNIDWIKNKRVAESQNSNVFESFTRYMDEPGKEKSEIFYDLITGNVRITRNLNNIHLEQDEKRYDDGKATNDQQQMIDECLESFSEVVGYLPRLQPGAGAGIVERDEIFLSPFKLNEAQMIAVEKLNIELKTMKEDLEEIV